MTQYVDKSVVKAEIERWRDGIRKGILSIPLTGSDRAYATFEYEILGKVRDFLNTLEVKEVENSNDAFEKAENFLEMLGCGFTITDNITHTNYGKEQLIEDFKKYMKGE